MRCSYLLLISTFIISGCGTHAEVSPSQNASLNAVSPSTSAQKGGSIQQALDNWLKEEWTPITEEKKGVTIQNESPSTGISSGTPVTQKTEEETPFTLQKYADKWKVYNEKQEKLKEGKPQEPSHIDTLKNLPVIGK